MSIVIYAATGDLTDGDPPWLTDLPANAGSLLRSASLLISAETVADYYAADSVTQLPTDTAIAEAFRDATCAQAALWAALGVDPNLGGLDVAPPKRSKGIGSAKVDYDTSAQASVTAFSARQQLVRTLCDESQRILRAAGMLSTRSWTYG